MWAFGVGVEVVCRSFLHLLLSSRGKASSPAYTRLFDIFRPGTRVSGTENANPYCFARRQLAKNDSNGRPTHTHTQTKNKEIIITRR